MASVLSFSLSKIVRKMTLSQFNGLKREDQTKTVYSDGIYVNDREVPEFTVVLYRLNNFFVELYYHEIECDPVVFKSFTSASRLNMA